MNHTAFRHLRRCALPLTFALAACAGSAPPPATGPSGGATTATANNDTGSADAGSAASDASTNATPATGRGGLAVNLTGAWLPAQPGAGQFAGLVLLPGRDDGTRAFFLDRVVQCIRAPCPPVREEGTYQVGAGELSLDGPNGARRYAFELRGETLSLREGGREAATLTRARSYCAQPADCPAQPLVSPRCVGAWSCEPDHSCAYRCGTSAAGGR